MRNKETKWAEIRRNNTSLWESEGWIYELYHFHSGKWYIGQTIQKIWERAQQHWYQRETHDDALHTLLSKDTKPFTYVCIPLEKIDEQEWRHRNREIARKQFREKATERERYWVRKIRTMWPRGWNSSWPGKPVSKWVVQGRHKDKKEKKDEKEKEKEGVAKWLEKIINHHNG